MARSKKENKHLEKANQVARRLGEIREAELMEVVGGGDGSAADAEQMWPRFEHDPSLEQPQS